MKESRNSPSLWIIGSIAIVALALMFVVGVGAGLAVGWQLWWREPIPEPLPEPLAEVHPDKVPAKRLGQPPAKIEIDERKDKEPIVEKPIPEPAEPEKPPKEKDKPVVEHKPAVPVGPPPDPIKVAPLKADREERTLPSAVSDVCVGASGRFVIYQIPQQRQLAIFDANEAKVVKYLPIGENDAKVAAGADRLIVYLPTANVLQRYNLRTFEREASVAAPFQAQVATIMMGSASRGPLFVVTGNDRRGYGEGNLVRVDPYTFKETQVQLQRGVSADVVRVSGDGTLVTTYNPNLSPQSQTIISRHGDKTASHGFDLDMAGRVTPGAQGRFVYTARGVFTNEGKPQGKMGSYSDGSRYCLPAAEGESFYLRIDVPDFPHGSENAMGKLYLHIHGDDRPIVEIPDVEVPRRLNTWGRQPFLTDKYLHLIPSAQLLVVLAPTMDKLFLHKVDVDQLLSKLDRDYLLVVSQPPSTAQRGKTLTYAPIVKSKKGGVKLKVEAGPDKMSVNAKGHLTWSVPADFAEHEVTVIATVSDASGQEIFHTFKLSIRD